MKKSMWVAYSAAFFLLPAALGLSAAWAGGSSAALAGICVGLGAVFASLGWTLRR
jgi:hypothetical protein